jgi:chaperone required for assembly of F1-ATPase
VTWTPQRRFWRQAAVRREGDGFAVDLDDRPLRTPAKAPLLLPTRALAEALAGEWNALDRAIDPARLPLTRAANAAIDRVARERDAVVAAIAAYGATDLTCYRAAEPEALRARQAAAWDPWLAWAARELGARLEPVTGLIPRDQPAPSLAALRAAVARLDPFALTALNELVTLSGSLVLGLAVARGALPADEAWALSRIDEAWQVEHWGVDAEAEAAAERACADFLRAEALLGLLAEPDASPSAG